MIHLDEIYLRDVAGDTAALIAAGSRVEMSASWVPDAPASFAYHRLAAGVRIEIVDVALREAMAPMLRADPRPG